MFDYARAFGRLNRDARICLLAYGLVAFGYFGVIGVLFNLYLARLGFGAEFIGLLIGSGQLVWAILALPAGALGARFGLTRTLVLAQVLTASGFALVLMVEWLPRPLWEGWLIVTWMILWLGAAFFTVNSVPYLMAVSGEERSQAFSLQQAAIALLAFSGSLAAGWLPGVLAGRTATTLEDPLPYRITLWLAVLMFVAAMVLYSLLRPVAIVSNDDNRDPDSRTPFLLYILFTSIVFFGASGDGAARAFFNLYLDRELNVATAQIGAAMGAAQLLPVALALATPLLVARLGTAMTLWIATLASALCIILMGATPNWLIATAALMGVQGAIAIVGPTRSLFSQEIVSAHRRTTTAALATAGMALGWAASAAFGGYLIAAVGFRFFFLVCATLSAVSALLLWMYLQWAKVRTVHVPVQN